MNRNVRMVRFRRKMIVLCAAMPLLQTTACAFEDLSGALLGSLASSTFNLLVGSINSTIVTLLPDADIIQILFGGNRSPFF